jgi:glycosyltransferase involved in cell wall biosynthesis
MRIAFYAPMKSPDHPVPSGDRQMARLLVRALEHGGHAVELASTLRSYGSAPRAEHFVAMEQEAEREIARLSQLWSRNGGPDLWFSYHPYYKAPDLIGPGLTSAFAIPYVTAEASYSSRRNDGAWAATQRLVVQAVERAALNISFTRRDRDGLLEIVPDAPIEMVLPFIDASPFLAASAGARSSRLVAVAMMRPGDKSDSFRMLARALRLIGHLQWALSIVGDGPSRAEIMAEFADFAPGRIEWHGEVEHAAVPGILAEAGIYVWPGCGEAYGLAYLEAQAAGLPVVAQDTAGVPEVVCNGETGLLTPAGDVAALASALTRLLTNEAERARMGQAARRFVLEKRSLEAAAARLAEILPKASVP